MTLTVPEGIDPELARSAGLQPDLDYALPREARAALARAYRISKAMRGRAAPRDEVAVTDRTAPARKAGAGIPVRVYAAPGPGEPAPALLFFHGGGFVTGDLETEDARCREIARRTGIVVISVDYRLAPEHPFPAAFEDCYDVLVWAAGNAAELGIDRERVAVGGTSAGGALAAAVSLAARDLDGPRVVHQLMLYPVTDHRMTTDSMKEFDSTPGWHQRNNVHMWRHYLGSGTPETVSPYAAPAMAEDLSGLPPAYVMTAEFDPLRDEGLVYARRLLAARVPVEIHHFPGTFHGFDAAAAEATVTRRALDEQCAVLVRATGARPLDPALG
ncbi:MULTISPECIES: alpha/beta hydrolase [unclassified Streptomyces]|uniref:alpha/beta hydrolase n=1 Tax=unclassified Streptomyces TaxID=2593676 RepID=UPI0022B5E661|nr:MULTISPECIES: alpha/beta hydrolase [unclassified Streptomyces]MCZ7416448.1 alpha/beta hydrolase [Streptomyces sp. WMMC897]MCZ7433741.1 alpha/beta hydrolase [Streptomyces sp. WMMC1477]